MLKKKTQKKTKIIDCLTQIAHTSRTADTVNVLLNVTGQVKVNYVLHVANVKTSCSHLEGEIFFF